MIKTILIILFVFVVFVFLFMQYAKKFENPYQLEFYIGVRGSGKSTFATKEAIYWQKKGYRVYSNFEIFGCYKFDSSDFGFYHLPPESVLLLDEVSTIWRNRDWKSFPKESEQFIRYLRKYRIRLRFYTQNLDTDVKLLSNMDSVYLLVKVMNVFTIAKKIKRTQVLHTSDKNDDGSRKSEGFITENYSYDIPTKWKVCYIPRWVKFFNSFEVPELPHKEYKKYVFNNEPYMYSLTHFDKYVKISCLEFVEEVKKQIYYQLNSFKMYFPEVYDRQF